MIAGGAGHIYLTNYFVGSMYRTYQNSDVLHMMFCFVGFVACLVCLVMCFKESYNTFKNLFVIDEQLKTKLRITVLRDKYGNRIPINKN